MLAMMVFLGPRVEGANTIHLAYLAAARSPTALLTVGGGDTIQKRVLDW
jgi:hypothetical protein